jgi:hypothetical protein
VALVVADVGNDLGSARLRAGRVAFDDLQRCHDRQHASEVRQKPPGADGPAAIEKEWLLHVPSGTFLTFEDLFVDPDAVHRELTARYLRDLPQALDHLMSSVAFIGDDAAQQEEDFRARYLADGRRIAKTAVAHFPGVVIGATGERPPFFSGDFSREPLPDRGFASWSAQLKDVASHLKPEFRQVLVGQICRPQS